MPFSPAIEKAIADCGARVCVGYPWWLRPWLMRGVIAVTLGKRIYVSQRAAARSSESLGRLLRHELVHVRQMNQHGLVVFVWLYMTEFFRHWRRERNMTRAYQAISFEVEATAEEERDDV